MDLEIRTTEDGSHTLYVPAIDESYHSTHGAIQESKHIFINTALKKHTKTDLRILEIGFGSGLNALLTWKEAQSGKRFVDYVGLELYPVPLEYALQLNYDRQLHEIDGNFFQEIHACQWEEPSQIDDYFRLTKHQADFTKHDLIGMFDVVYFDAFSPQKQPELWTQKIFETIYEHCNQDAILTTYCAKGEVRRALISVGFRVERLSGPPGKREILRATKN